MATTAGAGSLIIGVLLVVLGLTMWFQKHVRVFAGVAAILLALVSLAVSNFGGFLIGFLLALVGGALGRLLGAGRAEARREAARRGHAADGTSDRTRHGRRTQPRVREPARTGRAATGRSVRNEPGQRDEREAPCRLTR